MNLSSELIQQVKAHLDEVRKYLGNLPADERQEILQSIESHIYDAIESRSDGAPTPALLEAVIAEMDPPESYGELPPAPKRTPRNKLVLTLCVLVTVALVIAGVKVWKNTHPAVVEHWKHSGEILEGIGVDAFRTGTSQKQLIAALGAPDKGSTETWLQWMNNHRVHCLINESRGAFELRFDTGFSGTTAKGITFGSSEEEVLTAYGEPDRVVTKNQAKMLEWSSQGILLWLTPQSGVHQIVVFRPHPYFPAQKNPKEKSNPIGRWVSVDLVDAIEQFNPQSQTWTNGLYLENLSFLPEGRTDKPWWIWKDGKLHHIEIGTDATYSIKEISGEEYLFLEWFQNTGNYTRIKYYVLKRSAPTNVQNSWPQPVAFEQGLNTFENGDAIILDEVLCSSPRFVIGDTVLIKGKYTLSSRSNARLSLTTSATQGNGRSVVTEKQQSTLTKGKGEFELSFTIKNHGCSHLQMYDNTTGKSIGGLNFGSKQQVEEMEARGQKRRLAEGQPTVKPQSADPVGHWVSVDFVSTPEQFDPQVRTWAGDLYLKELTFLLEGKTDRLYCTWKDGVLHHSGDNTDAKFFIKSISGEEYLFLEWISGDVTQPPKYYVLKKGNPESTQTPQLNPVFFEQGCNTLKEGDSIVLDEVLSTSPQFAVGDAVTVRGHYTLASQPEATLLLTATATQGSGRCSTTEKQRSTVTRGAGEFELTYTIPYHGCSHLAFYNKTTGQSLGGLYFGTKEQVNEIHKEAGTDSLTTGTDTLKGTTMKQPLTLTAAAIIAATNLVAEVEVTPASTQSNMTVEQPDSALELFDSSETARAWQQTESYAAPNFYAFFPNDPDGGKALDVLWYAKDRDSRPDKEIFETVRKGLRCARQKTSIVEWIGSRYICGKSPQNPDAIEIVYHAADFSGEKANPQGTRHSAIYWGLSQVNPKTPAILRTLTDLCMRVDDPNDIHPIMWNSRSQIPELLHYLEPYLQSDDNAVQNKAIALEQIFTGKLKAFDWAKQRAEAQAAEKYTSQLADIKNILETGSSLQRKEAQQLIMKERITLIMDDSFISAFAACAGDADASVRNDVARLVGGRWIWGVPVQSSEAIELMLLLSKDSDREVRYNAVYYGLSGVQNKNEIIIRRLLEMAFDDREPNLYGRIAWSLRESRNITARLLDEYIAGDNPRFAQCALEIYEDMTTGSDSSKKKTKTATSIQADTDKTTGTQQTKSKVKVNKNPDISSQDSAPIREVKTPNPAQTDSDKTAEIQRIKARERMRKDLEIYSQDELRDIETLYQVANKKWRSEEGKESLKKLIEKYKSANRTGCALLYLGQMTTGDEQMEYLQQAIDDFSDCFYGDGAQVGAYARFVLWYRYRNDGEKEKAAKLAEEIRTDYPDAIDHRGRNVVALLEANQH